MCRFGAIDPRGGPLVTIAYGGYSPVAKAFEACQTGVMAEHVENSTSEKQSATGQEPPTQSMSTQAGSGAEPGRKRRAESNVDWSKAKDQIVGLLSGVARWLGVIFAVILVLRVIFVIGEANTSNGIVTFVQSWSDSLSVGFENLFTPDDHKLEILVNYGIAAIFWLIVSTIVAKIIRRVGDSINV